ncbi:MAG: hypothetical protein JW928_08615 [Candidatus Aureabacteria bacterium]|nr:hypothetical protein [Candidatus Auribacterota bacterium]
MKFIYLLTAFLCLSASIVSFAGEAPSAEECAKITILSPNGWKLEILKDGSAELSYGRMVQDTTHVKKGTFSFQDVFESLSKHLQKSGNVLSSFTISLKKSDASPSVELFIVEEEPVKVLFDKAKETAPLNTFFRNAWKNNPPGLPKE